MIRAGSLRPRRLLALFAVCASAGLAACKEAKVTEVPVPVASIQLSRSDVALILGTTDSVTAKVISTSGKELTARAVQWSSDNTSVAGVNSRGVITAAGAGTTRIVARAGDASAELTVRVTSTNRLTILGGGIGTGVVIGDGINCLISRGIPSGTCSLALTTGSTANLVASPMPGDAFGGWTGACAQATPSCSVTLNGDQTVTAQFNGLGQVVALAAGRSAVWSLTVERQRVFWIENNTSLTAGAIYSVPIAGGAAPELFLGGLREPSAIGSDNEEIFWIEREGANSSISKKSAAGIGVVTRLASGLRNAQMQLAFDAANVYVSEEAGDGQRGQILKISKTTGQVDTLVRNNANFRVAIATGGNYVYYRNGLSIMRANTTTGVASVVAAEGRGDALEVLGGFVYWVETNPGAVRKAPLAGGPVITLANGADVPDGARSITSDNASVYWLESTPSGTVRKVSVDGGPVAIHGVGGNSIGLAYAAPQSIYWTAQPTGGPGWILRREK